MVADGFRVNRSANGDRLTDAVPARSPEMVGG
jgi:hypothetical protein